MKPKLLMFRAVLLKTFEDKKFWFAEEWSSFESQVMLLTNFDSRWEFSVISSQLTICWNQRFCIYSDIQCIFWTVMP
jgi:hypothetical protein